MRDDLENKRILDALKEYDGVMGQAVAELAKRGDKDFFWEQRVEDAVEVMRGLRRKHKKILGDLR